jgi:hypothetical protein
VAALAAMITASAFGSPLGSQDAEAVAHGRCVGYPDASRIDVARGDALAVRSERRRCLKGRECAAVNEPNPTTVSESAF